MEDSPLFKDGRGGDFEESRKRQLEIEGKVIDFKLLNYSKRSKLLQIAERQDPAAKFRGFVQIMMEECKVGDQPAFGTDFAKALKLIEENMTPGEIDYILTEMLGGNDYLETMKRAVEKNSSAILKS